MIEFGPLNLIVREAVNGAMALSALLLLVVFGRYSWNNRAIFRESKTTQAAVAILVLVVGHFIRAFSSWIEFLLVDVGWDSGAWTRWTWIWFLMAGALIISGKALMLHTFAPEHWRRPILAVGLPTCVLVPIIIAMSVWLIFV